MEKGRTTKKAVLSKSVGTPVYCRKGDTTTLLFPVVSDPSIRAMIQSDWAPIHLNFLGPDLEAKTLPRARVAKTTLKHCRVLLAY
jgi:hypothetical protein